MLSSTIKPKTCAHCGQPFQPWSSTQKVCSTLRCATGYAKGLRKKEKESTRARKAALKTLPELKREAQVSFNAAIRERDRLAGVGCISCGRVLDWSGNQVDCGHFRSVGAAPHLRFDERNAHAQCKHCNQYLAGNVTAYRIGLIQRIGLEAVESLEADNTTRKWSREELIGIRDTYRQKLKELKS